MPSFQLQKLEARDGQEESASEPGTPATAEGLNLIGPDGRAIFALGYCQKQQGS
jgi:hypothetical protein